MRKYTQLPLRCNCSHTSLEWAAQNLGPSFVYVLSVSEQMVLSMRTMLKKFGADTVDHPMSPYVNLEVDKDLKPYEWYLSAYGKSIGSEDV